MLSILIPTYNYNIVKLVTDLHQQAIESAVDFEIIVMEDGSTLFTDANRVISDYSSVRYLQLEKNIGRAAIRNRLADEAKYDHLLFLDCDAEVNNLYFLKKYLVFCRENCVVLGGRIYKDDIEPKYSLLSTYGKMRERNGIDNLKKREKYRVFTTPNFLIPKSVFNHVRFDESITGYGHEDTVFGIMLQKENIDFHYIDNPVVHVGIEDNNTYIMKTGEALRNLYALYKSGKYPGLENESKILSVFNKIEKFHLTFIVILFHKLFLKLLINNLKSPKPSLFIYDLYKIGFLAIYSREKQG